MKKNRKKLMIVDDSLIIRHAIEAYLAELDFEVVGQAANGIEALSLCREKMPDVITMDITMPEMDGLECTTEILKIKPDAKIIIVSAVTHKATVIEALQSGAMMYVKKPFTAKDLSTAVEKAFKAVDNMGGAAGNIA